MRYIGQDYENIFLKCGHCKKICAYDRKMSDQKFDKKCLNCNARFQIIWGYPVKIPGFLRWPPFLIMTGLSFLVIFIITFPPFQRHYYFNKSVTALNPLVASILVPALCSVMSIIAEIKFSNTSEDTVSGFRNKIKLLTVIAVESIVLIFVINTMIEVKYHCLEIENPDTCEIQQYFGASIGDYASGKGRLFDSRGNLVYLGDFKDNLYDGYGEKWELIETIRNSEVTESYQCVYRGQFKKSQPHGQGCEYRYDAEYVFQKDKEKSPYLYYEGEFVEGKYGGYGTLYNIMSKHEGMFYNGETNGYGNRWFLETDDNKVYKMEAIYANGSINGAGKKYYSDGKLCFDGEYKNGRAVSGKLYYRSGMICYDGEFNGTDYNGKGTLYRKEGQIQYEGEWYNNDYNGNGKLYWENGQIRYDGEWKDDKREGYGTSFRENGKMEYAGYWLNNQYSGSGIAYYEDGISVQYEGDYANNERDGYGTEYYRNGNLRYKGDWCAGNWNGTGIWYWDNGNKRCNGSFMMNSIMGDGILYTRDETKLYEGYIRDGKRNDWGTSYYSNGLIEYEGNWSNDEYSGEGTEYDMFGNVVNVGIFNAGMLVSQVEEE